MIPPIPISVRTSSVQVRKPVESDYGGEYGEPETIENVRFEGVSAMVRDEYRLVDGAKGLLWVDATSKGAFAIPEGCPVQGFRNAHTPLGDSAVMSDGMRFKVEFDAEELLGRFVSENAKKVLLDDIKADSNEYVPVRTGTLRHSAVVDVSDGSVSWTTEYAQAMYERDHVGSTKNAKATGSRRLRKTI